MIDGISIDQLRTFVAIVDDGSFSRAARTLLRAPSSISGLVKNLEDQLGLELFDRSGRLPKLTNAGTALLADAREIVTKIDGLKSRSKGIASGIEPELSVVVNGIFPLQPLIDVAHEFHAKFPKVSLRLVVEALGGAYKPVIDGTASFGVVGAMPFNAPQLTRENLTGIELVVVCSPNHPLASTQGLLGKAELGRYVQLVLTDRSDLSAGQEFGVISPLTWRFADLFAKHSFLLNGLGWGTMPRHFVDGDLSSGRLIELQITEISPVQMIVPIFAIYQTAHPPGRAGQWFIDRLKSYGAIPSAGIGAATATSGLNG